MVPILKFLFVFLLVLNFLTLSLYWILPEAEDVPPRPVLAWSEGVPVQATTPTPTPTPTQEPESEPEPEPESTPVPDPVIQNLPDQPLLFTEAVFTSQDLIFETPPVVPEPEIKEETVSTEDQVTEAPTVQESIKPEPKQELSAVLLSRLADLETSLNSDVSEPSMDLITQFATQPSPMKTSVRIEPPQPSKPEIAQEELQEPLQEVTSQPEVVVETEVTSSKPETQTTKANLQPSEPPEEKEGLSVALLEGYAQVLHPIFSLKDQEPIYPDVWVRCKDKKLRVLIAKKLVENTSGMPLNQDHIEFWLNNPSSPPPKKYGEVSFQIGIGLNSEPWVKTFIQPGNESEITVSREDKGDFIALDLQGFQGEGLQWNLVFSKSSLQDGEWKQGHLFSTVKGFEWGSKEHLLELDQDLTGPL